MSGAVHHLGPWRQLPWLLSAGLHASLIYLAGYYWFLAASEIPFSVVPVQLRMVDLPEPAAPAVQREAAPPEPEAVVAPLPQPAEPPAVVERTPVEPAPPLSAVPTAEARSPQTPQTESAPASSSAVAAAPPVPRLARPSIKPELQEVARGGYPGMMTTPLMRTAPLTPEQWKKLDETYHTGEAESGVLVEPMRGPLRAAASKPTAPLTAAERKKLDEVFHAGEPEGGALVEPMRGPLRAAASKPSAPLTKEQWRAQEMIYWTGMDNGGTTPVQREAGLRGALSFQTSLDASLQGQPGAPPAANARRGLAARATERPMPEIPADLILDAGEIVVVARFLVASDGVAQVELTGPAPEPKLNEVLLAALRKWRFTPAFRDGRAVESTVEARLEISLRDQ